MGASSSFNSDPHSVPADLLPSDYPSLSQMYQQHWPQIRTCFNRGNRLLDWYNLRLTSLDPQELTRHTQQIFHDQ